MERVFQSIIDPLCPFARNRPFSLRLGALQYFAAHRRSVLFIDDRFGSTLTRFSGKLISFFLAFLDDAPRRHVVAPGPGPCSPPASNYDESSWRLSFFSYTLSLPSFTLFSAPTRLVFFCFSFLFCFFCTVQGATTGCSPQGRRRASTIRRRSVKRRKKTTKTKRAHEKNTFKYSSRQTPARPGVAPPPLTPATTLVSIGVRFFQQKEKRKPKPGRTPK